MILASAWVFYPNSFGVENAFFSVQMGADMVTVSLPVEYYDGMPYVPLEDVVRQVGGSATASRHGMIQVNCNNTTVGLLVNSTTVQLPNGSSELVFPIRDIGQRPHVALADIPILFSSAFNLSFVRSEPSSSSVNLTPVDPDDLALDMLEDSLLESVDSVDTTTKGATPSIPSQAAEGTETEPKVIEEEPEDEVGAPSFVETEMSSSDVQALNIDLSALKHVSGAIIIDPGHGGEDKGAVGGNALAEKDFTLSMALRIRDILKDNTSLKILLTRGKDVNLDVSSRKMANDAKGVNYFITLHAGYAATPRAQGISIFTDAGLLFSEESLTSSGKEQAVSRQQTAEKAAAFAYHLARTLGGGSVFGPVKVRSCPLLLQRDFDVPVIILEMAYLSNMDTAALMSEEEYQEQGARELAWAIATALK